MAFVRWRGTCAELLATVYENGRSRQILLANFPAPYASLATRLQVTREHPDISIDWLAVDRALARGLNVVHPVEPALTVAQVESMLRGFAQQLVQGDRLTRQAAILLDAADVLFTLRDKHPGETADLSSDDRPRPPPRGAGPPKPQASRNVFTGGLTLRDRDGSRLQYRSHERLWNNTTSGLDVLSFPDALRKRIVRLAPANPPTRDVEAGPKSREDGRKLRDYQERAIDAWFQAGTRGILSMATGTGKTYTAICAAKHLLETKHHVATVVVVPFVHLGDQWANELQSIGFDDIVMAYGSRDSWWPKLSSSRTQIAFGLSQKHLVVVTTTDTFSSDAFQHGMKDLWPKTLLIADEMHNLGAPKALAALPSATPYRLGLSATPERWFDEEGTNVLSDYFGNVVFSLPLKEAIGKYLTNYEYRPMLIPLTDDELEEYHRITRSLSKMWFIKHSNDEQKNAIESILFKRARLLGNAKSKIGELARLMLTQYETTHNIFYCGSGRDSDDERQLDKVLALLGVEMRMRVHSFTSEEAIEKRRELLDDFESGKLQGLVAIRCLDEGVDVPATRRAFILASSRNPREFIQRRGRVLRQFPGKEKAEIYDFVVIPTMPDDVALLDPSTYEVERRLLRRELERVGEFARTSLNPQETMNALLPLKKAYDILDI